MIEIRKNVFKILIITGFILTLLMIEVGPFSSAELSKYTDGYGTFDMKSYDYESVLSVMSHLQDGGNQIALGYYAGDFIFIFFFGALQIMISNNVWRQYRKKSVIPLLLYRIAVGIPILRGICDVIENIILASVYITYPAVNRMLINISRVATGCKLFSIQVWGIMILLGIVVKFWLRGKRVYENVIEQ